ncbi:MAG: undecaprenyldiphospho-muramoylpentapeptide beta-N-acetylglucosaminyltransferase [Candidatus Eisenbacteria bacterium]|nr:undecaprenyldiphospho-muramoylpentapeptide beta-N-acetylglucosaminyltransferase [Candidatus Eisenbacteria bacterium]
MRVMIAGGGTGGHIFPAIAIADAVERIDPAAEVLFAGRAGSLEERAMGATGRPFLAVPSMGLRRAADPRNVLVPFVVGAGYAKALLSMVGRRPDCAVGTGGFVSLPAVAAAWSLGSPVVLQEQNSYPGLATRLLSRHALEVHTSFDVTASYLPAARRTVVSGNPVRQEFLEAERASAREGLGLAPDAEVLFVVGGSGGARTLNRAVAAAADELTRSGVTVVAQTGEEGEAAVAEALSGTGSIVSAFFDDVADCYAAADLVVARAGATTIAEIQAVGRPSVLVPYPYATEDHQTKNAIAMQEAGASMLVQDDEMTGVRLAAVATELMGDRARLTRMSEHARSLARPDAADRVARAVLAAAGGEGAGKGRQA